MIAAWKKVGESHWVARWNGVDLVVKLEDGYWRAYAGAVRHRRVWSKSSDAMRFMDTAMNRIIIAELRKKMEVLSA